MSAQRPEPLKRAIPATGELLPAVGLGTYEVFDVDPSEAGRGPLREVLRIFAGAGRGLVDSSPMYGNAERVVGDLSRELGIRESLFLATKVWTTGRAAGIRQMETSFKRMGAAVMDLMQVHNLTDWETHWPTILSWKEKGKVRYTGITHYTTFAFGEMELVMKAVRPDFIQIYYSIATRDAEERLLPLAADLGIGVIVNRPLETSGLFRRVGGNVLPPWAAEIGCATWSQFFLKFLLSHPAVTCVIPATADPAHLEDNLRAGIGPLPDAAMRSKMAHHVESL